GSGRESSSSDRAAAEAACPPATAPARRRCSPATAPASRSASARRRESRRAWRSARPSARRASMVAGSRARSPSPPAAVSGGRRRGRRLGCLRRLFDYRGLLDGRRRARRDERLVPEVFVAGGERHAGRRENEEKKGEGKKSSHRERLFVSCHGPVPL